MYPSVCSSCINVLYSYINLTISDFLHSVEIAFFLFSFFSFYVCICASVFLLTCNSILFTADVNWLPGSASLHGYSKPPVTLIFTFNIFICRYLCLSKSEYKQIFSVVVVSETVVQELPFIIHNVWN